MAKRRSNHEGTIFKEKATDLWVAEIIIDGKKVRKRSKRQQTVREWLQTSLNALEQGVYLKPEKITVSEFIDRFMNDVGSHTLRTKTLASYKFMVDKHIRPEIGNIKLSSLRPDTIQNLYSKKLDEGLSKRSVQYIHAIIRRILNQAVKWNLIIRNPTDAVIAPTPNKVPPVTLTVGQIQTFLDTVKYHKYFPIYCIAIGCGLREGEILAIRKKDVSFEEGIIYVRQTIVSIRGHLSIGEPKSESSKRIVAMPDFVSDALALPWQNADDLIFTTSTGKPISPRNVLRHFQNSLVKAGIPRVKFHSLRHSFVSFLLANHVPVKDVQVIAGHSSFAVTMDIYGHLMANAHKEAAKKLEGVFKV